MANGHIPRRNGARTATLPRIGWQELAREYNIVNDPLRDGYAVVTQLADPLTEEEVSPQQAVGAGESTARGETVYRRTTMTDYNPDLAGTRGIDKYREMDNDAVVHTSLLIDATPIVSADWFVDPASQDEIDKKVADFIWNNLTEWMTVTFHEFLMNIMLMRKYGVSVFEKVFDQRDWDGEQRIFWRKMGYRHPYDIDEFVYDENGGPESVMIETDEDVVPLEIYKALIFTNEKEGGDLWGTSVLRRAYKHWFYKENLYKIDAIQKERHGIGIPVVKLPQAAVTDRDKVIADKIGQALRTNEKAQVTLMPYWEVYFMDLPGQMVDALASAQHHADKLYENVLANFMTDSVKESATVGEAMFMKSARLTATIITSVINRYAIPQLVNFNWDPEELGGYPKLKARHLGDVVDLRTWSFAFRNLTGADALRVDQGVLDNVRDLLGLPAEDEDTMLVPEPEGGVQPEGAPQAPRVGQPRQSRASNQRIGPGSSNTGQDRSGG